VWWVSALDALAASIAHEVKQSLSGIFTNASACLRMPGAETLNIRGRTRSAMN
jgi:hypothetical protein